MSEATGSTLTSGLASSNPGSQLAALVRSYRPQVELLLATALYLGFACYLTWPLVTNLAHSIYGAPGDPYGTLAFYRELVAHHLNPFLPGTVHALAAPEGQAIPWARDLAAAPGVLTLYVLTAAFSSISAYGLYTLAGYTLTGAATFLFARRLTANTWASLIAGWAFAFYPFAAINGQGHLDYIQGWVLVLAVWRLVELHWQPTRRNGLLAGLAVVLAMWWSPYFILFVGVVYIVFTVTTLASRGRGIRAALIPQSLAALIVVAFSVCLGVLSTAAQGEGIGVRTHDTRELTVYGARPLEYLLPDAESPLFGSDTRPYLESIRNGVGPIEDTLYLGVTVILLALIAFMAFVRRRLTSRLGSTVLALWLVAIAAAVTSMPPEVNLLGSSLPFPSYFISQATTTWRVYERFVIVVMLALSVLAAVGLDTLVRGRTPLLRFAIMLVATIAVPLDLWTSQKGHVDKIVTPAIYKTLARQPAGLVAEYPLAAAGGNTYSDVLFQSAYNKPMINGYLEGSAQELRALSLYNLAAPTTASQLATLGVRYVLLDSAPASWGQWPPTGQPGVGFRLITREPYAALYAVTAHPSSPALATPGEGFKPVLITASGLHTWLEQTSGVIDLTGTCTTCDGTLSITLTSVARTHRVTIFGSNGNRLAHGPVTGSTTVSLPLQFKRHMNLRLTATPGPQPLSGAVASSASVEVTHLEFTAVARASSHHRAGDGTRG
jgi:hypothetical protein